MSVLSSNTVYRDFATAILHASERNFLCFAKVAEKKRCPIPGLMSSQKKYFIRRQLLTRNVIFCENLNFSFRKKFENILPLNKTFDKNSENTILLHGLFEKNLLIPKM